MINLDPRFLPHNSHLEDPALFASLDPQLRSLKNQIYVYRFPLLKELPMNKPGIYTLGGSRQIGKTTLLKQWMLSLLENKIRAEAIAFFTGELIDDHHALLSVLSNQLQKMPQNEVRYILIDEITYIKDWDKSIKYMADAGLLENVVLMLTGSDLSLIQEARMRFPGRRGLSSIINFHLYPLSFKETVLLKNKIHQFKEILEINSKDIQNQMTTQQIDLLFNEFQDYLIHGGFLTAINDYAKHQSISVATLVTYSDWIRGDVIKRGRQEHYLREIIASIIKRYNSQITWNALAKDLSIDHPKTVSEYANLLESMDALFIQHALLEDKLTAAPKKGKKLIFMDPFIFHALNYWLSPTVDPFHNQIVPLLQNTEFCSKLVEACVATHYKRFYPTYYISAKGEVDIAYILQNRFWPIEIKWTNQLRTKDLNQVLKYKNARIFSKQKQFGTIEGIPIEPLPLSLARDC